MASLFCVQLNTAAWEGLAFDALFLSLWKQTTLYRIRRFIRSETFLQTGNCFWATLSKLNGIFNCSICSFTFHSSFVVALFLCSPILVFSGDREGGRCRLQPVQSYSPTTYNRPRVAGALPLASIINLFTHTQHTQHTHL